MNSCADIAAQLLILNVILWLVVIVKGIVWLSKLGEPTSHHSTSYTPPATYTPTTSGYGHDFTWRGHEAQEAYREKHWGSYQKK